MIYGVIDLGSNTIRLSVFKYEDGKIKLVQNKKTIAGLASCIKDGGLTEVGVSRACFALNRYKTILAEQNIKNYSVSVSYTHLTLPTNEQQCRSRWSPYH